MAMHDPRADPHLRVGADLFAANVVGSVGDPYDLGNRRIEPQGLQKQAAQPLPILEIVEAADPLRRTSDDFLADARLFVRVHREEIAGPEH